MIRAGTHLALGAVLLVQCSGKRAGIPPAGDGHADSSLLGRYEKASPPVIEKEPASVETAAAVEGIVEGIAPETDPPLYGRAISNVVTVYEKPDMRSLHMGYLRKGAIVVLEDARVEDRTPKPPSCRKGWWMIADGGGYICSSKGIETGKSMAASDLYPVPPATDAPMPYGYGHVMTDLTPLYERPPTAEEEAAVQAWVAKKKKELTLEAIEKEKAKQESDLDRHGAEAGQAPAPPAGEPAAGEAAAGDKDEASPEAAAPKAAPEAGPGEQVEEEKEEKEETPFDFVRMLMLKGFYVSIDREVIHGGVRWLRTVKGQYVKADKVLPINIRIRGGKELDPDFQFPAAIVLRETIFERNWNAKHNHIMKNKDVVYEKFDVFHVFGKQVDKVNDIDAIFYEIDEAGEKMVLSWSVVPVLKPEPPPPELEEGGKWIHVDISDQRLTAYEGDRPVFMTLVSSGNEEKDEEFATPRGTFWIQSKHVSTTMDNLALDEEAYSIEDVPWTMYFHANYALHGAFWHSVFGHLRSHGCVNMTPQDAKWIFDWSDPRLPLGWHGIVATKDRPGTLVKVTD